MKKTYILSLGSIVLLIVVGVVAFVTSFQNSLAGIVTSQRADINQIKLYDMFTATTTPATSTPVAIEGAKRATFVFAQGSDGAAASLTEFSVEVSNTAPSTNANGEFEQHSTGVNQDFVQFNKLISNVTNTNSQTLTRVGKVSPSTATSTYSMDLDRDTWKYVRCIASVATTDGTNASSTCQVLIDY